MRTSTIRPGMLVSVKTAITGGVDYRRVDLEADHVVSDTGARRARWETTRIVEDPTEYERAVTVRANARNLIVAACSSSAFGLLCPLDRAPLLESSIAEAKRMADVHNETASRSFVSVYVLAGTIASTDVEAARSIASEVRDLLSEMETGIAKADPAMIRKASSAARALGSMLTEEASEKVSAAIEQARSAARTIVKRIEKAGEEAASVIAEIQVDAITGARFAFLDLEEAAPSVPVEAIGRAVDLAPEMPAAIVAVRDPIASSYYDFS